MISHYVKEILYANTYFKGNKWWNKKKEISGFNSTIQLADALTKTGASAKNLSRTFNINHPRNYCTMSVGSKCFVYMWYMCFSYIFVDIILLITTYWCVNWTHKVRVLWNTLCSFVCLSIYYEFLCPAACRNFLGFGWI